MSRAAEASPPGGRALMWFRADLRTRDNTALLAARRQSPGGVVGVFLVAGDQWREHDWSAGKVDFIFRCVADLRNDLAALHIPLWVVPAPRFSDAASVLLSVTNACHCSTLAYNIEYEFNEQRRDAQVNIAFESSGRRVIATHDQTLLPPGSVRTQSGGYFSVFTPFKSAFGKQLSATMGERTFDRPVSEPAPNSAEFKCRSPPPMPDWPTTFGGPVRRDLWPSGQKEAQRRLNSFARSRINAYQLHRDIPCMPGTSTLSPYLSVGAISIRECWKAADNCGSGKGPTTWMTELMWREFYRSVLVGFPRISRNRPFRVETDRLAWRHSPKDFDRWAAGQTGFPIIDAGMRQLAQTGWMHNRLRMLTAMFLTKNLLLDWRLGERHFMRHLIDGDLAQNNGGWQWSASTGTDAVPYFRMFNPTTQSRKFDPEGTSIRTFVPELAHLGNDAIHDPAEHREAAGAQLNYPSPMVNLTESRRRAIQAFRDLKAR